MTVALWNLVAKFGLMLVGMWIDKRKDKEEMQKLYYKFLKQISVHSDVAVSRALELEKILLERQKAYQSP